MVSLRKPGKFAIDAGRGSKSWSYGHGQNADSGWSCGLFKL